MTDDVIVFEIVDEVEECLDMLLELPEKDFFDFDIELSERERQTRDERTAYELARKFRNGKLIQH
jgi:hypothetical protein